MGGRSRPAIACYVCRACTVRRLIIGTSASIQSTKLTLPVLFDRGASMVKSQVQTIPRIESQSMVVWSILCLVRTTLCKCVLLYVAVKAIIGAISLSARSSDTTFPSGRRLTTSSSLATLWPSIWFRQAIEHIIWACSSGPGTREAGCSALQLPRRV